MIEADVLAIARNGTCAIGYITVPLAEFTQDPESPFFKVVGSGFLVRQTTAMTNRHVVEALVEYQADLGFPDAQRMVAFVAPREGEDLQFTIRMIRGIGVLADEHLDAAFVDFLEHDPGHFQDIGPLAIQDEWDLAVTEPVALVGYPYGQAMLQRRGRVYRWGPVVQQGHISAISPFDTTEIPNQILMDVRVAAGMSGAPIFRPRTGQVIGILHSMWKATTALGLPLTQPMLDGWLAMYDAMRNQAN